MRSAGRSSMKLLDDLHFKLAAQSGWNSQGFPTRHFGDTSQPVSLDYMIFGKEVR
jgi:hypothetical protein